MRCGRAHHPLHPHTRSASVLSIQRLAESQATLHACSAAAGKWGRHGQEGVMDAC
jgi:hypothetical protein